MQIDVHTHTFPDALATRALTKLVEKAQAKIQPISDGTVSGLLRDMYHDKIDYAVVCPIATRPEHFDGILIESLALRDGARGHDAACHLIPFASVHPDDEARFDHLKQVADCGIRGIKLHPYYQPCVLDAPGMLEYFRCCCDLDLVVQCHCGFDIGFPHDEICNPERVAHVIHEVPGLHFIASHLGGWCQWEQVEKHLLGKAVYLDTAVPKLNWEAPQLNHLLREHPTERLLFATDWPWLKFDDGIQFIHSAGLTPQQEAKLLGGNAATLLGLPLKTPTWKNVATH